MVVSTETVHDDFFCQNLHLEDRKGKEDFFAYSFYLRSSKTAKFFDSCPYALYTMMSSTKKRLNDSDYVRLLLSNRSMSRLLKRRRLCQGYRSIKGNEEHNPCILYSRELRPVSIE